MGELIIESYGKINLTLDILHKRKDGYHEINSVMQRIDLKDTLAFKEIDKGIIIESNNPQVPKDSTNLVYKAWEKLKQISGIDRGIHVKIDKRIPVAAGLAGGSSNGAATLQAINQLWNLKLSDIELMKIGKDLGADIPFCIMGGTALAQGIGEKLIKLKPFTGKHILLCNPGIEISTAYAYSKVQLGEERLDVDKLISCIEREDLHCVAENLGNKMETPIIQEYPIIDKIKSTMIESGALGALMSGSGPTVFGIYDDEEKLLFTKDKLKDISKIIIPCKTI
ncbi:4-(cytidine 5'-diphospho)-2-C-methyl-D-erythritol kinase [Wansuia hejianensis]|uniref:4-diphosphocytidyl-2-C-methyl-D-erythritol kinase n=1 Tax=Wansuia hejianensis TaxID=2763667 RepID=A0A926ILJ9_9FIRM|nr:4-(cytidine 5'-diphospho)-2-C-methyl-D-erythritol kinase [Wansuia hejianensis]MBC8590219.1 4-(cytidine 5'-diphospho)-2-C-methyl-D-erythritol kinase [Wansuia hejianensis]